MQNAINWSVLGAAGFAQQYMAPAIHAMRGARLVGLATSDPAKAARFLEWAPDLQVLDTYDALLDDPAIDAVYVPLPDGSPYPWSFEDAKGRQALIDAVFAMARG